MERLAERLQQMADRLAQEGPPPRARLREFLGQALGILHGVSIPDALRRWLGPQGAEWVLEQATGYLHLGFTAPREVSPQLLSEVAGELGFADRQAFFASEIMAREYAWRLGCSTVVTQIFRADRPCSGGLVFGVEAFLPELEEAETRRMVREGVGSHLALGLASPESVEAALRLCQSRGYAPPPFFEGQPLLNVANAITVAYVDADVKGETLRWEFYHSRGESPTSSPRCWART